MIDEKYINNESDNSLGETVEVQKDNTSINDNLIDTTKADKSIMRNQTINNSDNSYTTLEQLVAKSQLINQPQQKKAKKKITYVDEMGTTRTYNEEMLPTKIIKAIGGRGRQGFLKFQHDKYRDESKRYEDILGDALNGDYKKLLEYKMFQGGYTYHTQFTDKDVERLLSKEEKEKLISELKSKLEYSTIKTNEYKKKVVDIDTKIENKKNEEEGFDKFIFSASDMLLGGIVAQYTNPKELAINLAIDFATGFAVAPFVSTGKAFVTNQLLNAAQNTYQSAREAQDYYDYDMTMVDTAKTFVSSLAISLGFSGLNHAVSKGLAKAMSLVDGKTSQEVLVTYNKMLNEKVANISNEELDITPDNAHIVYQAMNNEKGNFVENVSKVNSSKAIADSIVENIANNKDKYDAKKFKTLIKQVGNELPYGDSRNKIFELSKQIKENNFDDNIKIYKDALDVYNEKSGDKIVKNIEKIYDSISDKKEEYQNFINDNQGVSKEYNDYIAEQFRKNPQQDFKNVIFGNETINKPNGINKPYSKYKPKELVSDVMFVGSEHTLESMQHLVYKNLEEAMEGSTIKIYNPESNVHVIGYKDINTQELVISSNLNDLSQIVPDVSKVSAYANDNDGLGVSRFVTYSIGKDKKITRYMGQDALNKYNGFKITRMVNRMLEDIFHISQNDKAKFNLYRKRAGINSPLPESIDATKKIQELALSIFNGIKNEKIKIIKSLDGIVEKQTSAKLNTLMKGASDHELFDIILSPELRNQFSSILLGDINHEEVLSHFIKANSYEDGTIKVDIGDWKVDNGAINGDYLGVPFDNLPQLIVAHDINKRWSHNILPSNPDENINAKYLTDIQYQYADAIVEDISPSEKMFMFVSEFMPKEAMNYFIEAIKIDGNSTYFDNDKLIEAIAKNLNNEDFVNAMTSEVEKRILITKNNNGDIADLNYKAVNPMSYIFEKLKEEGYTQKDIKNKLYGTIKNNIDNLIKRNEQDINIIKRYSYKKEAKKIANKILNNSIDKNSKYINTKRFNNEMDIILSMTNSKEAKEAVEKFKQNGKILSPLKKLLDKIVSMNDDEDIIPLTREGKANAKTVNIINDIMNSGEIPEGVDINNLFKVDGMNKSVKKSFDTFLNKKKNPAKQLAKYIDEKVLSEYGEPIKLKELMKSYNKVISSLNSNSEVSKLINESGVKGYIDLENQFINSGYKMPDSIAEIARSFEIIKEVEEAYKTPLVNKEDIQEILTLKKQKRTPNEDRFNSSIWKLVNKKEIINYLLDVIGDDVFTSKDGYVGTRTGRRAEEVLIKLKQIPLYGKDVTIDSIITDSGKLKRFREFYKNNIDFFPELEVKDVDGNISTRPMNEMEFLVHMENLIDNINNNTKKVFESKQGRYVSHKQLGAMFKDVDNLVQFVSQNDLEHSIITSNVSKVINESLQRKAERQYLGDSIWGFTSKLNSTESNTYLSNLTQHLSKRIEKVIPDNVSLDTQKTNIKIVAKDYVNSLLKKNKIDMDDNTVKVISDILDNYVDSKEVSRVIELSNIDESKNLYNKAISLIRDDENISTEIRNAMIEDQPNVSAMIDKYAQDINDKGRREASTDMFNATKTLSQYLENYKDYGRKPKVDTDGVSGIKLVDNIATNFILSKTGLSEVFFNSLFKFVTGNVVNKFTARNMFGLLKSTLVDGTINTGIATVGGMVELGGGSTSKTFAQLLNRFITIGVGKNFDNTKVAHAINMFGNRNNMIETAFVKRLEHQYGKEFARWIQLYASNFSHDNNILNVEGHTIMKSMGVLAQNSNVIQPAIEIPKLVDTIINVMGMFDSDGKVNYGGLNEKAKTLLNAMNINKNTINKLNDLLSRLNVESDKKPMAFMRLINLDEDSLLQYGFDYKDIDLLLNFKDSISAIVEKNYNPNYLNMFSNKNGTPNIGDVSIGKLKRTAGNILTDIADSVMSVHRDGTAYSLKEYKMIYGMPSLMEHKLRSTIKVASGIALAWYVSDIPMMAKALFKQDDNRIEEAKRMLLYRFGHPIDSLFDPYRLKYVATNFTQDITGYSPSSNGGKGGFLGYITVPFQLPVMALYGMSIKDSKSNLYLDSGDRSMNTFEKFLFGTADNLKNYLNKTRVDMMYTSILSMLSPMLANSKLYNELYVDGENKTQTEINKRIKGAKQRKENSKNASPLAQKYYNSNNPTGEMVEDIKDSIQSFTDTKLFNVVSNVLSKIYHKKDRFINDMVEHYATQNISGDDNRVQASVDKQSMNLAVVSLGLMTKQEEGVDIHSLNEKEIEKIYDETEDKLYRISNENAIYKVKADMIARIDNQLDGISLSYLVGDINQEESLDLLRGLVDYDNIEKTYNEMFPSDESKKWMDDNIINVMGGLPEFNKAKVVMMYDLYSSNGEELSPAEMKSNFGIDEDYHVDNTEEEKEIMQMYINEFQKAGYEITEDKLRKLSYSQMSLNDFIQLKNEISSNVDLYTGRDLNIIPKEISENIRRAEIVKSMNLSDGDMNTMLSTRAEEDINIPSKEKTSKEDITNKALGLLGIERISKQELSDDEYLNNLKSAEEYNQLDITKEISKIIDDSNIIHHSNETINKNFGKLFNVLVPMAIDNGVDPSLVLSQFVFESGWGTKESGKNNYFNIKANKDKTDDYSMVMTSEYENGKWVKREEPFKNYNSLEDSAKDYIDLIKRKYTDKDGKMDEDKIKKYGTDPKYKTKIENQIKRFNDRYSDVYEAISKKMKDIRESQTPIDTIETNNYIQEQNVSDLSKNFYDEEVDVMKMADLWKLDERHSVSQQLMSKGMHPLPARLIGEKLVNNPTTGDDRISEFVSSSMAMQNDYDLSDITWSAGIIGYFGKDYLEHVSAVPSELYDNGTVITEDEPLKSGDLIFYKDKNDNIVHVNVVAQVFPSNKILVVGGNQSSNNTITLRLHDRTQLMDVRRLNDYTKKE